MTGYGRGECARQRLQGHRRTQLGQPQAKRNLESCCRVDLEVLEAQIRDVINRSISADASRRAFPCIPADGKSAAGLRLNAPLARAYARELGRLAKELKLAGPLTLELIARSPGVLESEVALAEAEDWPATENALGQALATLLKMRERKAADLARDLVTRVNAMRKSSSRIRRHARGYRNITASNSWNASRPPESKSPAPTTSACSRRSFISRIARTFPRNSTRLQSHFQQFSSSSTPSRARHLGFLTQIDSGGPPPAGTRLHQDHRRRRRSYGQVLSTTATRPPAGLRRPRRR